MKISIEDLTVSLKTEITYKELIAANQRMVDKLKAHVDGNIDCSIELDNLVEQYTELSSRTQGLLSRIGRLINKESEEEANITERKKIIKEAIKILEDTNMNLE